MPYILFLFIAMPIIEIALLLRVGDAVGWLPTLFIVITTAVIGSSMLRQQGLATLNTAKQRLNSGELPAQQLLEGMLIMIGGVLLLTPGFVTDTFGFLCLIPPSRRFLAARISERVTVGMSANQGAGPSSWTGGTADRGRQTGSSSGQSGKGASGDVIDGDFRRIDDE